MGKRVLEKGLFCCLQILTAVCIDDAHVLQVGFIKIIFESVKFEIQQPFFLRI